MKLKTKYTYGGRWSVSEQDRRPISSTSYEIYFGEEDRQNDDENLTWLNGRMVVIKTLKYPPLVTAADIISRRESFARQLEVLALPHFMIPEPLDYCLETDHHTPELANTDLGAQEPMLVYAYSPGITLRDYVAGVRGSGQVVDPLEALELARRIVALLEYLHTEAGYGHMAINPDHFLYHNGSLRVLGLSKIVPIDRASGKLIPHERPIFPPRERAYLPSSALIDGQYSQDTEAYGVGMLLFFLIGGRCPSSIQRPDPDGLPFDQIDLLPVCRDIKALIAELTMWPRSSTNGNITRTLRQRIEQGMDAQVEYNQTQALIGCKVGIFADLENMIASFRTRRDSNDPQDRRPHDLFIDLDAIASAYARHGPAYKVVVLGRHNIKGLAQKAVAQLQRSGWQVIPVDSTVNSDGKTVMGELDDSVLINASNRFLEVSRPDHFILISNDSDYQRLLEKAQVKDCHVTLIYGSARGRSSISAEYIRQVAGRQIQVRHIGTYPFVFTQETNALLAELNMRIQPDRASIYKAFTWEFVRQLGYDRARELLRPTRDQRSILTMLDEFVIEQVPWVVSVITQSNQPQIAAGRISQRRRQLLPFAGAPPAMLNDLLNLPTGRNSLLDLFAEMPDLIIAEWPFIKANLGNPDLLRIFLQQGADNDQLRAVIKAVPDEIQALLKQHRPRDLISVIEHFGPVGLTIVRQHGEQGITLLQKYGAEAIRLLQSPNAGTLKSLLSKDQPQRWIDLWYGRTGTLAIVDLLQAEPLLEALIRRDGIGAVEIYQAEQSIAAVEQSHTLATLVLKDIKVAYQVWQGLRAANADIMAIIARLQSTQRQTHELFRRVEQVETLPELVRAVADATDEGCVQQLSQTYQKLGPATVIVYRRYGREIFTLISQTDYPVVHLLNLFPDALPDLQRYGKPAYLLIREFQELGYEALVRLRYRDLQPLFEDAAQIEAVRAWHGTHQNLQAIDWLTGEPALAQGIKQHGLVVLELYAIDQDLALVRDAIAVVPVTGISVEETYGLLRAAATIPRDDLLRILTRRHELIFAEKDAVSRAQVARAFYNAELLEATERLDQLIAEVGPVAVRVFDRHALALFTVIQTTEPAVVGLLDAYPSFFADIQRYGQAAYRLVQRFGSIAISALERLRGTDLLQLLSNQTALTLLGVWHERHGDLGVLDVLIEQPNLLAWTHRYLVLLSSGNADRNSTPAQAAADMLEQYVQHRSPELIALALSLAESGHLGYPEAYEILHAVQRPSGDIAAIIIAHGPRLTGLTATVDRQCLVQLLYDAQRRNLGAQIVAAFDGNRMATLNAYRKAGETVLDLARQLEPQAIYLLADDPAFAAPLQRYGQAAYSFIHQFGADAGRALLQLPNDELTNALSDPARPAIMRYRNDFADFNIIKLLALDWPALGFFERYPPRQALSIWLLLREHNRSTPPSILLKQYEDILFHSNVDVKRLVPLVGLIQPQSLRHVINHYPNELFAYTNVDEQVQLCRVLTEILASSDDARRYIALAVSLDRTLLLALIGNGGLGVVELLERLDPTARSTALSCLHRLSESDLNPCIATLLGAGALVQSISAQGQKRLFEASQRVGIETALQSFRDYGEPALNELVSSGKLNWFFKLTHRKR